MQTDIQYAPAYALALVSLAPHESIRVEAGAMVSMSSDLGISTGMGNGFMRALKRSMIVGESFFVNTFTAPADGARLTLAPILPGDMLVLDLNDQEYKVQAGGFVACAEGIDADTKWGGAQSFFGGDFGLFLLRCEGTGQLVLASYGALHRVSLAQRERITIDTGHVVAFSAGVDFDVRRVGGWKSTILSGEGFVVNLTGPGEVFMQTRSQPALIDWMSHYVTTTRAG